MLGRRDKVNLTLSDVAREELETLGVAGVMAEFKRVASGKTAAAAAGFRAEGFTSIRQRKGQWIGQVGSASRLDLFLFTE